MKRLLMMVGSAAVALLATRVGAETTADYVQDGLVACWDGYENDGAGTHATTLSEWKDTSGTYSFVFTSESGITVDGAALLFPGTQTGYARLSSAATDATFEAAKSGTCEIVLLADAKATQNVALQSSSASGIALGVLARSSASVAGSVLTCTGSTKRPLATYNWSSEITTFSTTYSSALSQSVWLNGVQATLSGSDSWVSPGDETFLGHRANLTSGQSFKGRIYAIRLYSTHLSAEDIAANHAVDVDRFVNGDFNPSDPNTITVIGSPSNVGTPDPAYGKHESLVIGTSYTFTCPPTGTDGTSGAFYKCTGWRLTRADKTVTSGTDLSLTLEFSSALQRAKLEWLWEQSVSGNVLACEYVEGTGAQYVDIGYTPNAKTEIEIVYRLTKTDRVPNYLFGSRGWNAYCVFAPATNAVLGYGATLDKTNYSVTPDLLKHTFTLKAGVFAIDGEPVNETALTWSSNGTGLTLLAYKAQGALQSGTPANARIYSVKITENGTTKRDLVPARRSSDGAGGLYDMVTLNFYVSGATTPLVAGPQTETHYLSVQGSPSETGTPEPAYGVQHCLVDGRDYSFTVPSGEFTNTAARIYSKCVGWRLALTNGTLTTGSELSKTITYGPAFEGATLYWVFRETALPRETVLHVETLENGGSDETGDGTAAKPYATITNALAQALIVDGWAEIDVGEGTFEQTTAYNLTTNILIRGAGRDKTFLKMVSTTAAERRNLILDSLYARVEGVTLQNGRGNKNWWYHEYDGGSSALIKRGTLADSRVTGAASSAVQCIAGAVFLTSANARLERCVVDHNDPNGTSGGTGGGVYVSQGVVDNCLICNNRAPRGGGLAVSTGGRVYNTTVANNEARPTGTTGTGTWGGVFVNADSKGNFAGRGIEIVNCIFYGNVVKTGGGAETPNEYDYTYATTNDFAALFRNCAFLSGAPLVGEGSFSIPSGSFTDEETMDYSLVKGNAAIDAGCVYAALAEKDLEEDARIQGPTVDIGCRESAATGFSCGILASTYAAWSGESLSFSAKVTGAADDDVLTYAWKVTDADDKTVATGAAKDFSCSLPSGCYSLFLTVRNVTKVLEDSDSRTDGLTFNAKTVYARCSAAEEGTWPYDTPAKASTNLQYLLDTAVDGQTIILLDTCTVRRAICVTNPVVLAGVSQEQSQIVRANGANCRVLEMGLDSCVVSNLTLRGGNGYSSWWTHADEGGSGVLITGGTLTDARVTGCRSREMSLGGAVMLARDGATLRRTIVDDNSCGGVLVVRGMAEDCLITHNSGFNALAIRENPNGLQTGDANALVRNCTVVSNTYTSGAGVWLKTYNYKTPAPWNNDHHVHLYNTIFAGNYATVDSSTVGGNEYMMPTGLVDQARLEACYTNCAFTAPHAPGANAVQLDSVEGRDSAAGTAVTTGSSRARPVIRRDSTSRGWRAPSTSTANRASSSTARGSRWSTSAAMKAIRRWG